MSEHPVKPAEKENTFGGRWIPLESNPEVRIFNHLDWTFVSPFRLWCFWIILALTTLSCNWRKLSWFDFKGIQLGTSHLDVLIRNMYIIFCCSGLKKSVWLRLNRILKMCMVWMMKWVFLFLISNFPEIILIVSFCIAPLNDPRSR